MFQYRSSAFAPSVKSIQQHLVGVEQELEAIGRIAGRRGSAAAAAAGEQVGDAITAIFSEMMDRFRGRGRAAGDQAARLGSRAVALGADYGSGALARVSGQVEDRPLLTLGVALGIGVLIGAAVLGGMSRRS